MFIAPQGLPDVAAHHEATAGMGALDFAPRPFLYPPHTIAQVAAVTRAAGLPTSVYVPGTSEVPGTWPDAADILAILVSEGTAHADETFMRILRWRQPGQKVLLFGPSARFMAERWLTAGLADAVLLGEPEGAIADAVEALADGKLAGAISAHTLRPDRYDAGDLLLDLDALPFPAWDLVPWQAYEQMASLLSSRGCPADCRFCAYVAAGGRRFRSQSIERTLAEWAWLAAEVQPGYLMMRDSVFAHDRTRATAICEGVIARKIVLRWGCESRPEHFDRDLLRLMKAAGCEDVKIGLESADPDLLDRLGRLGEGQRADAYLAHVRRVARDCADLGLICRVFVMAGLSETQARTEAFLRRLPPQTTIHALPYQAHPDTALTGPSASVPAETLASLTQANRPRPALWQRMWAAVKGSKGAGERESRGAGEQIVSSAYPLPSVAFITGGNGFVGGHVAAALVAAGSRVVALVRPGSALGMLADLPPAAVEIVTGDLAGAAADWADALRGCDVCFHIAARYAGPEQADAMYAVNVAGTNTLLAACASAGIRRVVVTSSIGTVGRPADPGVLPDERTPFNLWHGASHYVRSKYLAELIARAWAAAGLDVVIVKPTAPVGTGDARPTATGARILAALRGEALVYPAGDVNHAPVRNIAAGHLLAAQRGERGQVYILGHREGNLDQPAFLRLVAEAAGGKMRPGRVQDPPLRLALTADPTRAIRELGLPQSDLREAFAEAVAWYRARGMAPVAIGGGE
ncbi:MAG: NAD-dependent epimerase/dehydratase family protein [Chloroflexi bacterium]|nr:NAD-dependent epimerase/dehydratase family protein [Chloroflexota bacterium]